MSTLFAYAVLLVMFEMMTLLLATPVADATALATAVAWAVLNTTAADCSRWRRPASGSLELLHT